MQMQMQMQILAEPNKKPEMPLNMTKYQNKTLQFRKKKKKKKGDTFIKMFSKTAFSQGIITQELQWPSWLRHPLSKREIESSNLS